MKLHADQISSASIQGYRDGWVQVNNIRHTGSLLITHSGVVAPWPCARFSDLTAEHFEGLLTHQPELVLFGSGRQLRFPHPSLYACLISRGIGMETMSTGAACRTFNILAQEGRRVTVALLPESD